MTEIRVVKRSGEKVALDINKITRVLNWAAEGLSDISISQVELKAKIQFFDGIETSVIHNTLIKTAADLISLEYSNYQYLAARLNILQIRKEAFGEYTPPSLYQHVLNLSVKGFYDSQILEDYNPDEFTILDSMIDHDRDLTFSYAAVKQLSGKYLVQDRTTDQIFESPQFMYMLISMCLFSKYDKSVRLDYVRKFYNAVSTFKISLPTPIMSGVRTSVRQYSSCVVIEAGDSLDMINSASASIVKYISQRAGIGINGGMIRALGSKIRNGDAVHTGVIPFYKHFQTAVKSCSQGGVRGGAATLFYPLWHLEAESLLVLKNNRGIEENRVRHLDYGVQINGFLYKRLLAQKDITLFSPSDVPGLYDAFFKDQNEFARLYEQYEQDETIRKKTVSAVVLFSLLLQERASTGRIYIQNVDHCNTHSPFNPEIAPIKQSNLCLEICLPTKPLNDIKDPEGEIALCTLAALNVGIINVNEIESLTDLLVRALNELLDYQNYPIEAAKRSTMGYRPLGIGVIGYAHWLAKNGYKYSDGTGYKPTHELFEAIQYYVMKSSVEQAKEKGRFPFYDRSNFAKGILPIDTYKKELDAYVDNELKMDWEALREDIKRYGIRNATLTAQMPSETSSQISNATNGIEPPRGFITVKSSKDGILKQVVPEYETLKDNYELYWSLPNNEGVLTLSAIMQKFICQAISTNTGYDPSKFPDGKVPMKVLMKDLILAYKLGVKTLYYHNTRDGAGEDNI